MIDDRDLIRRLEDPEVWDQPEPPELDLAAITGSGRREDRPAPHRRTWNLTPLVAIGGALACTALGVIGGVLVTGGGGDRPVSVATTPPTTAATTGPAPRQVALSRLDDDAPAGAAAEVNVFTATDGRTVDLRVTGLQPPRKGEFYELWVLGDGKRMISLGVIRVDASGSARARMPLPVSLRRFPVFDISLEPGDGNPAHSGHSVLRSAAAA